MSAKSGKKSQRIGEMLVDAGIITHQHLQEGLAEQRNKRARIIDILIEKGYLDIPSFVSFLTRHARVPGIDIFNYDISPDITDLIPADFARTQEIFPLDKMGNLLTVGMVCPLDSKAIEDLEKMTNLRVRAFVCNKADLTRMIDRYYRPKDTQEPEEHVPIPQSSPDLLAASIRASHLAKMIRSIDALPPLPSTFQRCREALENPDTSTRHVAEVIETDPMVAADLLRTVNSPAFGLSYRVSNVASAVSLLGIRETYMIVLAANVPKLFKVPKWFDLKDYRHTAVLCASICRAFAKATKSSKPSTFFAAGLLHDLGTIVLAVAAPDRYRNIVQSLSDQHRIMVEEEALGISHTEAGYALAIDWALPPEIIAAIRYHAAPEMAPEHREIAETVALALDILGTSPRDDNEIAEVTERNLERLARLGLTKETFAAVTKSLKLSSTKA